MASAFEEILMTRSDREDSVTVIYLKGGVDHQLKKKQRFLERIGDLTIRTYLSDMAKARLLISDFVS